MSRHWANIGEGGTLRGLRFMAWVYRNLGRPAFNLALAPVVFYFMVRRPLARRSSRLYLRRVRRCYPESLDAGPTIWQSYLHFFNFGEAMLDKCIVWLDPPDDIAMDDEDRARLSSLIASGTGCLVIGSHFGNLEYARGIAHRHPDLVINILIHDKHAAKFAALLTDSAPQSRLELIQVTELDLDLSLELKERVGRGEWLLIAGDRVPVGEGNNVCAADFLGEPANFPIGPYVLARLLRCPVYLLHCFREAGRYRLGIERFADEVRPDRSARQVAYAREVQRFASALEAQVRRAPLQWFNFYDFWEDGSRHLEPVEAARDREPADAGIESLR